MFQVKDPIWFKAWPFFVCYVSETKQRAKERGLLKPSFWLCFKCLENRLGRKLTIEDFSDALGNEALRFGYNLGLGA